MTEKKKLSSLIRFHSASKIYNYNGVGGGWAAGRKKRKGKKKNLQNKSKDKNSKGFPKSLL